MRYFFLAYAIIAVLFVGIMGFRGQKFHKPPVQVFPDMDNQDKLKAQAPSIFFADRKGGRMPVDQTQPRGFNEEGQLEIGGIPEYEFGGQTGYYYTGHVGDYYGFGMPEELSLTTDSAGDLIRRGEERFGIYCAVCHGKSGDGLGITSRYGVPGIANLHGSPFQSETYPDGRMFEVITQGKGQMGAYGTSISVRDRWAIISYVRVLQAAKISADVEKAAANQELNDGDEPPPGAPPATPLEPDAAPTNPDSAPLAPDEPEAPASIPDGDALEAGAATLPTDGAEPKEPSIEAPELEATPTEGTLPEADPAEEADQ